MADTRLSEFVATALRAGATKADVQRALEEAGWSREQIVDGLAYFADVAFVTPVPRPRAHVSARDAFWYLLMFGTLYTSAFYLGNLLFDFINLAYPDELVRNNRSFVDADIRWSAAWLIVSFPISLLTSARIARDVGRDPAQRNSAIRRWLTYVTLLVAATALLADTATLVYNLLGGELTLRFVLKVLVVAAIAGAGFGYFLWSVRADDEALRA